MQKPNQGMAGKARIRLTTPYRTKLTSIGVPEIRPKAVSVAVLFALALGPFGLFHCTTTGVIVMLIVTVVLHFLMGYFSLLIVLPICVVWASKAAREQSSAFD